MTETAVTIITWWVLIDMAVGFVACVVGLGTVILTAFSDYWRYVKSVR